jgi:hypothetical protein
MRQRGRKGAAHLELAAIVRPQPKLQPPAYLTKRQRTEFAEIIDTTSASHFAASDVPLIASMARVNLLVRELARGKDFASYEKAIRMQVLLARSLRLTVQSRTDPKTVGRNVSPPMPPPWED